MDARRTAGKVKAPARLLAVCGGCLRAWTINLERRDVLKNRSYREFRRPPSCTVDWSAEPPSSAAAAGGKEPN